MPASIARSFEHRGRFGTRSGLAAALLGLFVVCCASTASGQGGGLVSETTARRHGLTRSWYAQMDLNQASEKIAHATLQGGMLFVQTTGAVVHALDAETGRAVWVELIGRGDRFSAEPAANSKFVAVVNGSTLYLIERQTGRIEWTRKLRGSPGAGPVLTETHAFVPMINGVLEGYVLATRDRQTPWIYQSNGRIFNQPVISAQTLGWTTDKGYFYVANANPMKIRARMQTRDAIESRPAYWTPYFYATSIDGYVYAIHERTAETEWKFSAGDAIAEPPIAIEGRVYVVPESGGMYCLDGANGLQLWFTPAVAQFVSKSPTRIYAIDKSKRMLILDAATGARLDVMPLDGSLRKLYNEQTDRVYLVATSGLIQCLHEIELRKPAVYTPPELPEPETPASRKKKDKDTTKADEDADGDKKPAEEPMAGDEKMDKEKPDAPAKPEEDPFAK
jgi:outer membrane protein assembly factor BamB